MSNNISNERKESLVKSVKKLQAYEEIQNTMGRCTAAFNFRQAEKVLGFFAMKQADVSVEYSDEGVFESPENVKSIIMEVVGAPQEKGEMMDMQLTTPMIVVADDLQTAKAVWWCPGGGAIPQENADPMAVWNWGQIAADFILEDGEWKIWHFHWFRMFKCSYEKGWVEDLSMLHRLNTPVHPLSKPSTYHNPYSPTGIREGIPACPRPYETYTDSSWMLETDKTK